MTFQCQVCGRVYEEMPPWMTCQDGSCGGPVIAVEEEGPSQPTRL